MGFRRPFEFVLQANPIRPFPVPVRMPHPTPSFRFGNNASRWDNAGNGTLKRSKKKSFDWYKKVIASNGEDLE